MVAIIKIFKEAAKSAGATDKKKLYQGQLLGASDDFSKKGICGGLCLKFLGLYAESGFGSMHDALEDNWAQLLEDSLTLQAKLTDAPKNLPPDVTTEEEGFMLTMVDNFTRAAPDVGLCGIEGTRDGRKVGMQSFNWPCTRPLCDAVTNRKYCIIVLPTHYLVVAFVDQEGVFYDPNAGYAKLEGYLSFERMVTNYLMNAEVSDAYGLSGQRIYLLTFEKAA